MANYVVIGGGISGLVAAEVLSRKNSESDVVVLEKEEYVGGLLSGRRYENEKLYFDIGTHIFQETDNTELDQFLLNAVPEEELIYFPVGKGDFAGAVFHNRLQEYSHFPDISNFPESSKIVQSIYDHLNEHNIAPILRDESLLKVCYDRFGEIYSQEVLKPLFEHMYQIDFKELSGFALYLPGLTRVICDTEASWNVSREDVKYRSVVAFPDQHRLPAEFQQKKRSFYARKAGTSAFINGIKSKLEKRGVRFIHSVTVQDLDFKEKRVSWIKEDLKETIKCDRLVFSVGAVGAAKLLGLDLKPFGFDRPMAHYTIDFLLKEKTLTDLFYLYGYDVNTDFYRVTNYRGFSGDSEDKRLTVEVLGKRNEDADGLSQLILEQLFHNKIIKSKDYDFYKVNQLKAGFPVPTVKNMKAMKALSNHLSSKLPEWVVLGGIGSRGCLFFQNEVVTDLAQKIDGLIC